MQCVKFMWAAYKNKFVLKPKYFFSFHVFKSSPLFFLFGSPVAATTVTAVLTEGHELDSQSHFPVELQLTTGCLLQTHH